MRRVNVMMILRATRRSRTRMVKNDEKEDEEKEKEEIDNCRKTISVANVDINL